MARSITDLQNDLSNLKLAGMGSELKDPAEKGTKTDVGSAAPDISNPGPSTSTSAETAPTVSPDEPAGKDKATQGDAASSVPSATAFTEPGKAADFRNQFADLKSKMAGLQLPSMSDAAPAAPAAPAAAASPETVAAAEKFAGIRDRIWASLIATEAGRSEIEKAAATIVGADEAVALVKSAHTYFQMSEEQRTIAKIATAQENAEDQFSAQYQAKQAAHFQALIDNAPSEEARIDITNHYLLGESLKEKYASESPEEFLSCIHGFEDGMKVAAAMAGGASPEEAMPGPEAGSQPGPEEIIQAIQELVATGQISEEEAQALIEQLAGGSMPAGEEMPPGLEAMPKAAAEQMRNEIAEHLGEVQKLVEGGSSAN